MDALPIYSVVTALHPAMHFDYWTDQGWGADYENSAREAVCSVWRTQYQPKDLPIQQKERTSEDNNMELILLGKRKQNKVDQLESFVTAPPVEEMPLDF